MQETKSLVVAIVLSLYNYPPDLYIFTQSLSLAPYTVYIDIYIEVCMYAPMQRANHHPLPQGCIDVRPNSTHEHRQIERTKEKGIEMERNNQEKTYEKKKNKPERGKWENKSNKIPLLICV